TTTVTRGSGSGSDGTGSAASRWNGRHCTRQTRPTGTGFSNAAAIARATPDVVPSWRWQACPSTHSSRGYAGLESATMQTAPASIAAIAAAADGAHASTDNHTEGVDCTVAAAESATRIRKPGV